MESQEQLLDLARAETRLDDFGDSSFVEGLTVLVQALRTEANLNADGEAYMRQMILRLLIQRLQIEDWYRRHPEIDETPIVNPLIGVSLPRTGSTALSFLLAQDPNIRYLRLWEAMEPCPPPSTVQSPDPRIARAAATGRRVGGTSPHLPSSVTGPTECLPLMALDFKSASFAAVVSIPSYVAWMYTANLTSTYVYLRRVLKLLQWGSPAKPWRLKSPAHLPYLSHIDRVFPDARFVMTHRDPVEVIGSIVHLIADVRRRTGGDVDLSSLATPFIHALSLSMERALAFRDNGHEGRFYDLEFPAVQRDPIGEVRKLYDWLGEPVTPEFEAGMARWWQENATTRAPNVHPDPASYGLDLNEVRARFAAYTERMPALLKRQAAFAR